MNDQDFFTRNVINNFSSIDLKSKMDYINSMLNSMTDEDTEFFKSVFNNINKIEISPDSLVRQERKNKLEEIFDKTELI